MIRLCRPQMQTDNDSLIDQIRTLQTEVEVLKDKLEAGMYTVTAAPNAAAGGEAKPQAPTPEPIREEAIPDDIKGVIANWDHIMGKIAKAPQNGALLACLKNAVPSLDDEGRLVLAFSDSFDKSFVEEDGGKGVSLLKQTIAETIQKDVRVVTKDISKARDRLETVDLRKLIKNVEVEQVG